MKSWGNIISGRDVIEGRYIVRYYEGKLYGVMDSYTRTLSLVYADNPNEAKEKAVGFMN